jgi:hypothetical protein
MPPKKKGNKKGQDDWEADLGETIAPTDGADPSLEENGENGDEEAGGGGLMAMLRKNKERRKKKGLQNEEPAETTPAEPAPQAQEANIDDEFALPEKKGKGGKGKPAPKKVDDDVDADSGRVLTKAEKEKLKKEREKQRKKEQVCCRDLFEYGSAVCRQVLTWTSLTHRPPRRNPLLLQRKPTQQKLPQRKKKLLLPQRPRLLTLVAKGRSFQPISQNCRSSKRN